MKFIVVLLIVLLLKCDVVLVKNPFEDACPPHNFVTSQNISVYWSLMENSKSSKGMMKSDPMCLDDDKLPVYRTCSMDGLRPPDPPDCGSTQSLLENMSPCPEPFQEIRYNSEDDFLCVLVSSAKEWSSDCVQWGDQDSFLHLDSKDLKAVKSYLDTRPEEKFWLPLRSSGQYLPFTWYLPGGDNYGHVFDEDKFKSWRVEGERLPEGNCLALSRDNAFKRIHIEDCRKHYPTICIYKAKKPHLQLACPENYFAARYHGEQNQCVTIVRPTLFISEGCEQYFVANTRNKIILYREVRKEFKAFSSDLVTCAANFYGLYPEFVYWDREMWLIRKDKVKDVFWSPNMHSYDTKIFTQFDIMALDSKGYWHIDPVAHCSTCIKVIPMFTPELNVVFHRKEETLELIIYSGEFLWRADADDSGVTCYTDADSALLSNVKIKDLVWSDKIKTTDIIGLNNNFSREYITKSIYELKIGEDTPGKYWCEGLSLPDYKVVRSAPVIAYDDDDGTAFAFRTIMECIKCKSGFTNKELKNLAKDFEKLLSKYDYIDRIEEVKTMSIEELPEDNSKLEVIFHVFVEDNDVSKDKCPKNITREICTLHQLHSDLERIANRASSRSKQFQNITVKHTEFCLPYYAKETNEIQWMSATIGERSVLQRLCLTTNLLPVYRFCTGNFIYGAKWDQDHIPVCREEEIPEITQKLFDLDNSEKAPIEIIDSMKEITYVDSSDIIPADLYLMGSLTRRIATANDSDVGFDEIGKIITIFSHTMEVNEATAKASQILNSTNTLLDMNERIMNGILVDASISNKTISGQETNHLMGVIEVKAKNIISYVIDPTVANVSGIALYRSLGNLADDLEDDFTVEYLYANQSTNALIEGRDDLEVATFVPQDLLNRINEINQTTAANATQQTKPPLRIVITVIANDRMFQENRNVSYYRTSGRIVTVTIPGYGPNLPTFLPIIFHAADELANASQACGYWDFSPKDRRVYSEWSTTGCEFLSMSSSTDPPIVLCGCSHITNFAFLLTGVFENDLTPEEMIVQRVHLIALDVITVIGCSLSLAGVVGIWITAMFFKTWREKAGSKVLLHLSVAIALQMLLFLFINAEYLVKDVDRAVMRIICITLGALLQYSVLVVFSWMLITAYLQYLRYVVVFGNPRPPHFTIKSIIVGWILPTLPVILVIGLDMDSYLPPNFIRDGHLHEANCYPHGPSLYFGVLLPIGIIFIANFATYIAVIYSITRKMDKSTKKNDTKIQMAQLRLSILLFFLLGMSWIFGFLVYTHEGGSIIFTYLFCLTATLQGFVLFSYFVIMDPTTRKMWEQFFTSLRCGKSEKFT